MTTKYSLFSVNKMQLCWKSAATLCDRQDLGFLSSCPWLLDSPVRRLSQVRFPGRAEIATTAGLHPETKCCHRRSLTSKMMGGAFLGTRDHWGGMTAMEKVLGITENKLWRKDLMGRVTDISLLFLFVWPNHWEFYYLRRQLITIVQVWTKPVSSAFKCFSVSQRHSLIKGLTKHFWLTGHWAQLATVINLWGK